jgi:tRNA pseudouridine55 synthase
MQKKLYDNTPLNKLLVVNKPMFRSSNSYLNEIKRKYRNKKAGFSGTLDPFAKGCLIVAFGQYAKLFKYLQKTPKTYKAVIWLGTLSESLDIENVTEIKEHVVLSKEKIKQTIESTLGDIEYYPPKFSAKKIEGKRAYDLARAGKDVQMKKSVMNVIESEFISYSHPFITFQASVSEGSYIRSLAQIILEKLNAKGTLSYLERLNEGKFFYENERDLNPLTYLDLPQNIYSGDKLWVEHGKSIRKEYLQNQQEGIYTIEFDDFFSIIQIQKDEVKYLLNKVRLK